MGDTNYFSGTVKILEKSVQNVNNKKITKSKIRGEIYQTRQNRIVSLIFWGNLAYEVMSYYQINDYILIEGYTSLKKNNLATDNKKLTKPIITVLKIYPVLLNSDARNKKC